MMKYVYFIIAIAMASLAPLNSNGQDSNPIFPDLYDQEALDSVVFYFKPTHVLNYGNARDYLYGTVYNENDTVECVYSGHKLGLPSNVDPSVHLFQNGSNNGINCEHTYPRSKGANEENGNAFSDMHHLFPTRSQVNSGRENFPFTEIPDEESTHWYFQDEVRNFMPLNNINLYSERINGFFEPREIHKGNAARAVFYFYTMYKKEADEADLDFFEIQKETLCKWNLLDPVDEDELRKTNLIAEKQDGLGNPFVLDQTLVDRCYCEGISTSYHLDQEKMTQPLLLYPNPVFANNTIVIESEFDKYLDVLFFSMDGLFISKINSQLKRGENNFSLYNIKPGHYLYKLVDPSNNVVFGSGNIVIL